MSWNRVVWGALFASAMTTGCAPALPPIRALEAPGGHVGTNVTAVTEASTDLRLDVIVTGVIEIPKKAMLDPDHPATMPDEKDGKVFVPAVAFLIRHPTQGAVLVDTGFGRAFVGRRTGDVGWYTAAAVNVRLGEGEDLLSQLAQRGVTPKDLRYVVITHGHLDHTGGLPDLGARSVIVGHGEETAIAARGALFRGYKKKHFARAREILTIDFDRAPEVEPLGHAIDLFGDGSILVFDARGHTPGHLGVLLNMQHGPVVLAGDTVQTRRAFHDGIPSGNVTDVNAAYEKVRRLQALKEDIPGLRVFGGHDEQDAALARRGRTIYR